MEDGNKSLNSKTLDKCSLSPVFVDYSTDLKQYMAVQEIPNFGIHGYFALSQKPIHTVENKRVDDLLENIFDENSFQVFDERDDDDDQEEYEYLDLSRLSDDKNNHENLDNIYFLAPDNYNTSISQNSLTYNIDTHFSQSAVGVSKIGKVSAKENLAKMKSHNKLNKNIEDPLKEEKYYRENHNIAKPVSVKNTPIKADNVTFDNQLNNENNFNNSEVGSFSKEETKIFTSETVLNNVCSDLMLEMQKYLESDSFLSVEKMLQKEIVEIFGRKNGNSKYFFHKQKSINKGCCKGLEDSGSSSNTDFDYQSSTTDGSDDDQELTINKYESFYGEPTTYNKQVSNRKANIKSTEKLRNIIPSKLKMEQKVNASKSFPTSLLIEDNNIMQRGSYSTKNKKTKLYSKEGKPQYCQKIPQNRNICPFYNVYNREVQHNYGKIPHWLAEGDKVYYKMIPLEEKESIFANYDYDDGENIYFKQEKHQVRSHSSKNCPLCLRRL